MRNNTRILAFIVVIIVALAITDPRIGSNIITYVILAVLAIVGMMTNNPAPSVRQKPTAWGGPNAQKKKPGDGGVALKDKEKKYLIFYLLTQLEKKDGIDMKELTTELNVGIYELNDLVRILAKHQVIELVYPPLQNFPIIRKGDPEKSKKYRMGIFHELARKTILGEAVMEDFAREVSDYLQSMKKDISA